MVGLSYLAQIASVALVITGALHAEPIVAVFGWLLCSASHALLKEDENDE